MPSYEKNISRNNDPGQLALFELENHPETHIPRVDYVRLNDPELRQRYVRYTESLIAKTIAGDKDMLVFLDKSARPVAWLMRALWPTLGISGFDEDGSPVHAPMPDMKFINFDREQWAPVMGRSEGKDGRGITLEGLHPDTIDSLTGLFATKTIDVNDYVSSDDATMFDDKNVLIIDEVSASGDTLTMAEKLLERAFQNAKSISGTHWMPPEKVYDKRSGGVRNADLPIWYSADTPYGRLVGDRDLHKSQQSRSMRQRRGAQFLSYRLPKPDIMGRQLRDEMQQLGCDVADGIVPVVPDAVYRPDSEEFEAQFIKYVDGLSVDEFVQLKRQAERESGSFTALVNDYKRDRDSKLRNL